MKILYFVLFLFFFNVNIVFAAATASQTTAAANMQRTIGGVINNAALKKGFAANDPRAYGTAYGAGKAIISGVATAGAGVGAVVVAGTSPAWGTVLAIGAGLAAVGYGVNLALDKSVDFIWGADNSVTLASHSASAPSSVYYPSDGSACGDSLVSNWFNEPDFILCMSAGQLNPTMLAFQNHTATTTAGALEYYGYTNVAPSVAPVKYASLDLALDALTPAQRSQPIDYQLMADLINHSVLEASKRSDYAGIGQLPGVDFVTAADVASFAQANPSVYPSVDAFTAPIGDISTALMPASPAATTDLNVPVTPISYNPSLSPPVTPTSSTMDFGIPSDNSTIPKIEVPVSYTPTVFASRTGCPSDISFYMLGRQYLVSYSPMCDLMSTLAPIFLAVGAAAAALIFASGLKS